MAKIGDAAGEAADGIAKMGDGLADLAKPATGLYALIEEFQKASSTAAAGMVVGGGAIAGRMAQMTEALEREAFSKFKELKKQLQKDIPDVGAMQKGSQEAASTINRWLNNQDRKELTLEQVMEAVKGIERQPFEEFKQFRQDFRQAAGRVGVG
jgi:hypothetical protein